MSNNAQRFGFDGAQWQSAKAEAHRVLIGRAKRGSTIAYSELVEEITTVQFEARSLALGELLGEISQEEARAGRGMLSVLVVHKTGDMKPGSGFFELARALDRDTSDEDACWTREFKTVIESWQR